MKPLLNDRLIREAVLEELESDPELSAKHISVTVNNGAVTLAGHVVAIHQKHAAVRAAERVDAVRAVADDIEVREPSLHELPDDEIAEEIAGLRGWGTQIPDTVAAEVRGGRVILHGQVGSETQRNAAETAVRRLTGVRVVDNLIKLDPQTE
jgi:osmotically-inducible protein OsmY